MYMMAHNNTGSPASSPRSAGPQSPSGAEVRTQSQEKTLAELRKDEFIPNDKKLIESLKNFREHYVRAPKMN